MLKRTLSLLTFVTLTAFSSGAAWGFSLVGSELRFRAEIQQTPTSPLLVNASPVSAIVSETTVEFPNIQNLFSPQDFPGFSIVNASVDIGADYLELGYAGAGGGVFANTFRNDYVFTFAAAEAFQITNVALDPRTNLALTPDRITFTNNELAVNVRGLLFNPNSFVRLNLTTVADSDPGPGAPSDPGRSCR